MDTTDLRRYAAEGIRARIAELQATLTELETPQPKRGRPPKSTVPQAHTRRRRMSPEVRKRLSEMMKARWAQRRKSGK